MKLNTLDQTATLYWAVVGYARWWLNIDAGLCRMVKDAQGKLTEDALAAIALQYNVARGLPGKERPAQTRAVLDVLNNSANGWPSSTLDRAEHCRMIAERLKMDQLTHNHQVSGVTKYMWFLRPTGWTVFDRFAADGMGVPASLPATERMLRFYAAIDAAGFGDADRSLQSLIDVSPWASLPAARVLDTFLMRRSPEGGMREGANSTAAITGFLEALPENAATSLHDLATKAQGELGKDLLPKARRT
jgi:hypothetical protein